MMHLAARTPVGRAVATVFRVRQLQRVDDAQDFIEIGPTFIG